MSRSHSCNCLWEVALPAFALVDFSSFVDSVVQGVVRLSTRGGGEGSWRGRVLWGF